MMKNSIGAACATVLVALAGGLATPTASHAVVYGGIFDPEDDNYKWFGKHVFAVDDACLVGDGWKKVNTAYGYDGCGPASLVGGDLTVVNKGGNTNPDDDVSKTLQFADFAFIPSRSVWGVNIVGGQLVGVDTFSIGDFLFDSPGETHAGTWRLEWSSGRGSRNCLYFGIGCPPPPPAAVPNGAGLLGLFGAPVASSMSSPDTSTVTLRNFLPDGLNQVLNNLGPSTVVSFQPIPEPTTVTLVLAALGAGWLTRRRKR